MSNVNSMDNDLRWQQGLAALNCVADQTQQEKLQRYLQLLQRWNKVYNLTAVRDPTDMLPLHIFDSLAVLPYLSFNHTNDACLDVGSGAGLPGIPLAIMRPEQCFTLLDTNGKKTRFIQQAVITLGLENVAVVQARVEAWQTEQKFAVIISRAFSSLQAFVTTTADKLSEQGCCYAMKGQYPTQEVKALDGSFQLEASYSLNVPELNAERHLLKLAHKNGS